jgi:hypothetical protein
MKVTKKLTALTLCFGAISLAACSGSESDVSSRNEFQPENRVYEDISVHEVVAGASEADYVRRDVGISDRDVLNGMLEWYEKADHFSVNRECPDDVVQGFANSAGIVSGVAVKVISGESVDGIKSGLEGSGSGAILIHCDVEYLFKITDNLTGHCLSGMNNVPESYGLPEGYMIVTSKHIGAIFELGKEYVIFPDRFLTEHRDAHEIYNVGGVVSRDLVSERDIARIRNAGANRGDVLGSGVGSVATE